MKQVYLLTGRPGTGKTSIIKQVVDVMEGKAGGFFTEEIRSQGVREGFRLVTLDGHSAILAHINIHSPYRVSKYGVDIDSLDRVGVSALNRAAEECDLVVVDEIGKMELFSDKFKESVLKAFDSERIVLGVIHRANTPFLREIKNRRDVIIFEVTRENQDRLFEEIRNRMKEHRDTGE